MQKVVGQLVLLVAHLVNAVGEEHDDDDDDVVIQYKRGQVPDYVMYVAGQLTAP